MKTVSGALDLKLAMLFACEIGRQHLSQVPEVPRGEERHLVVREASTQIDHQSVLPAVTAA